jgi:hypothetical protein
LRSNNRAAGNRLVRHSAQRDGGNTDFQSLANSPGNSPKNLPKPLSQNRGNVVLPLDAPFHPFPPRGCRVSWQAVPAASRSAVAALCKRHASLPHRPPGGTARNHALPVPASLPLITDHCSLGTSSSLPET